MNGAEFFHNTQEMIRLAVAKLGYSEHVYKLLRNPRRTLEVHIGVHMPDGSMETFLGYRSQHAAVFGPYKGGVRFHPNVTKDEVEALAILMSLKNSALGLPYGGGKGGVICDPTQLADATVEQIARGYVRGIGDMIGPLKDIPAPDVNTNARIMGWMVDEYLKMSRSMDFSAFTGKSTLLGGIEGRAGATGLGVAITVREACKAKGVRLEGATVAIQGFGNVGRGFAEAVVKLGARVVAVADVTGAIYNPKGIDLPTLGAYVDRTHGVADFAGAEPISGDDLFALDVDVLAPCALEGQITDAVAKTIRARIVAEGANGPTTPEGSVVLYERGIMQIPDIVANGGGVTVSYFEWAQDRQGGLKWPAKKTQRYLDEYMVAAFHSTRSFSERYKVSMRDAAYLFAVDRLAKGMLERGWLRSL